MAAGRRAWFSAKAGGRGGAAPKRGYAAEICGGAYGREFGSYPIPGFGLGLPAMFSAYPWCPRGWPPPEWAVLGSARYVLGMVLTLVIPRPMACGSCCVWRWGLPRPFFRVR